MSVDAGKDTFVSTKYDMPLDKNLKITYQDKVDLIRSFTDPQNAGYSSGWNVELKI